MVTIFIPLLLRIGLNALYAPLKLIPVRNKVVFLSRQSDVPGLDLRLIAQEIKQRHPGTETVFLCSRLLPGIRGKLRYLGHLWTSLYHLATASYAVVDSYLIQISLLKHRKELTVLQTWHALGAVKQFGYQTLDKASGSSSKLAKAMHMHSGYNYILAPSEAVERQFAEGFHADKSIFRRIGLPRVDYILREDHTVVQKLAIRYPAVRGKQNILYAPTFRRGGETDLKKICEGFDFEHYNLIVKYHDLDPHKPGTAKNEPGPLVVHDEQFTLFDLYKACDAMITDYSSAVFEFSLLQKPIYFFVYDYDEYTKDTGVNIDLWEEFSPYISKDMDKLMPVIASGKYDLAFIRRFRDKYLEIPLDGTCTAKIVSLLWENCNEGRQNCFRR